MYTLTTLNNTKLSILTINAIVFSFCLMTPASLNYRILPFPLLFYIKYIQFCPIFWNACNITHFDDLNSKFEQI